MKPSEWIKERADEINKEKPDIVGSGAGAFDMAIMEYLDILVKYFED